MPDFGSLGGIFITVIAGLFSAGVTWGIVKSQLKNQGGRADAMLSDLKEAVRDIRNVATEIQVLKTTSGRAGADIERHEIRLSALEIAVAKLQAENAG